MTERNIDPQRPQRVVSSYNPETRRSSNVRLDVPINQRPGSTPLSLNEQKKLAEAMLNQTYRDPRRMPGLQQRPTSSIGETIGPVQSGTPGGIPTNYGRRPLASERRALIDRAKQIGNNGFPEYKPFGRGESIFPGAGSGKPIPRGGSSGGNRIPPGGSKIPGSSGPIGGEPLRAMPRTNIPGPAATKIPLPASALGKGLTALKGAGDAYNAYNGYQAIQRDLAQGGNKNTATWLAGNFYNALSLTNPSLFPTLGGPIQDALSRGGEWVMDRFNDLGLKPFGNLQPIGGDPMNASPRGGGYPPGELSAPIGEAGQFIRMYRVINGTSSVIGEFPAPVRVRAVTINQSGYTGKEISIIDSQGNQAYVGIDLPPFQTAKPRLEPFTAGPNPQTYPPVLPFDPVDTVEPIDTPAILLARPSREGDPFFPNLKDFPSPATAPGTVPAGANKPSQKPLPGESPRLSPGGVALPAAAPTAAPTATPTVRPANPSRDQQQPQRSPIPPRAPNPAEPKPSAPTAPQQSPSDNPGITSQPGPGPGGGQITTPTPTKDPKQEFQIPFLPIPPIPARAPVYKPTTEGNPTGGNPPVQPPNGTDPPCKGNRCGQAQMQKLDQQGNKLDQLQTALQGIDLSLLQAMNGKLDVINSKLGQQLPGGIAGKLTRLGQWLHLDRVLNVLTFTTTLHNAYMLSNGLSQTLFSMFSNVLAAIGIKDDEGNPLDVGSIVGKTVEAMAKEVLGVETVDGIKAAWKKFSRIYQAAANIIFSVQSIGFSIISILEILGSMTGKIGNALRGAGAVFERAYGWFNPQPNFQNRFFTALQRTEDFVSNIDAVASETLSIQETINQFGKQKEDLDKAINQSTDKVSATAVNAEASKLNQSASDKKAEQTGLPVINVNDLIKPSEP